MRFGMLVAAAALVCCSADSGQNDADATSCEGAHLDGAGRCRSPSGHYAQKSCCIVSYAPKRRDLTAYTCPEGGGKIPVAFFDADSTLRISRSGSVSASEIDDVYVLPFAASHIKALNEQGML